MKKKNRLELVFVHPDQVVKCSGKSIKAKLRIISIVITSIVLSISLHENLVGGEAWMR